MRTFRAEIFTTSEERDEMAKKLSEQYGEPCVVLPSGIKPEGQNIAYLCDGYACEKCHPEYCHHTTDISHAKNFTKMADGRYIETDQKCRREAWDE